ncbi:hydrogenase iron-sulfur subunit [Desulfococcus sp.]|jgi:Fe-S oxidoreductase/coenzyme F420-reducing hydrogenase delta subunit|uniref:hydrogenase iron-sulfur subunit n=1 Tax=Desulfococcus sp. TaxID=2025834 RepID=UPI003D0CF778
MSDYKIILYLCNWAPHTAYHNLQDNGYQIPPEIKMVRVSCTGRITKALLLKAFEMGADGVALVGCGPGTCRYGTGTLNAVNNTEDTERILELAGIGGRRLRFATFLPDDTEPLRRFLAEFTADIKTMGKSPVVPMGKVPAETTEDPTSLADILKKHDAYACQDCGKCTSACPLALSGKPYSPRALVGAIAAAPPLSEAVIRDVWACLTCGLCHERCPSDVDFPEFIRDVRSWIHARQGDENQAHGGFFQSLMRTMTSPEISPGRWKDRPADLIADPEGKTLFFGGCAPYFDIFFRNHAGLDTSRTLFDAVRLLNFFDVHPRLLETERCCGHDLLWSGDRQNFLKLARLNTEMMNDLGIETLITACPECYRTLSLDYPRHGVKPAFTVMHLYEFLEREIDKGAVTFAPLEHRITYQDACRLNRLSGVGALPRKLIHRLMPTRFTEMKDSGAASICCGNCAWTGCDAYSKALQVRRIRQAAATGSDLMVTSCPKCQIHLRCAMEDPFLGRELMMETADLTSVIARTIRWE